MLWMFFWIGGVKKKQVKMNLIPVFVLEILVDRLWQTCLNKCINCVCCLVVRCTQLYAVIWDKPFRTYLKSSFTAKLQCINFCFSTQWEFNLFTWDQNFYLLCFNHDEISIYFTIMKFLYLIVIPFLHCFHLSCQ